MLNSGTEHSLLIYLGYGHGLYNIVVIMLFLFQGWLGIKIRNGRISGNPLEVKFVRRHRKFGPFIAILGIFGFTGGIATAYLSEGEIFEYPLHFLTGMTISSLIIITFMVSRKIRGRESTWRTIHYYIGLMIISLYFFQAFLGIGILFYAKYS
jgi:Protein of unknown function (DUF4079)